MPRPARRLIAAIALASALALSPTVTASAAEPEPPVALAPEEGAFVESGSVVLEWTAVDAPEGYEVTWSTGAGGEAGTVSVSGTSTTIEVGGGSFVWQVRALPAGEWSAPATFHLDVELPTLGLPEEPVAAPASPRPGLESVPGSVWILGALGFSAVFLVIVVIQSRLRREQDA